jgi:hypothetical protein
MLFTRTAAMNNQSHCFASETLLPESGSRFQLRCEACRAALSNRGHAPARLTLASISELSAPGANGSRVNPPAGHAGKISSAFADEPAASLFSHAADPTRQPQSRAMLIRQALGGLR